MNKANLTPRRAALGLMLASILTTGLAQAGWFNSESRPQPVRTAVSKVQNKVSDARDQVADLRETLSNLPEIQRQKMLERFTELKNNPGALRDRIDQIVSSLETVAEPAQAVASGTMAQLQSRIADRIKDELTTGQPGLIAHSFGLLYDLTNPMNQALAAADANSTRSRSYAEQHDQGRTSNGWYRQEDPQSLDDCILHDNTQGSIANSKCVIRLLAKPVGASICDLADLAYDLTGDLMPDDVTTFYIKGGAVILPAIPRLVCIIAKGYDGYRDANSIDEELRFKIESNLVVAESQPLAMFQTPGQFGGKLEVVEQLVMGTLANARSMGMDSTVTSDADSVIVAGSTAFSGGEYQRAYHNFACAYRSLTTNTSALNCQH